MDRKYGNEPTRDPDIEDVGRAWELDWPIHKPDEEAMLAGWLVEAEKFGHPIWNWYYVGIVHLRPIEGARPPTLRNPDVTHEFMVMAMNPEHPFPDIDCWDAPAILFPADQVWQFTVRDDAQAKLLGLYMVEAMCRGESPDQDYRAVWRARVAQTAEHICYGGHPAWN